MNVHDKLPSLPRALYQDINVGDAFNSRHDRRSDAGGHPGSPSNAQSSTAALIGWEWLQREKDIFGKFDVTHYRPKERPNMVRIVDEKTRQEGWIPLFDDAGVPLFPELMVELDAV